MKKVSRENGVDHLEKQSQQQPCILLLHQLYMHEYKHVQTQVLCPFPGGPEVPAVRETLVRFPGQEDPLEKEQATHSSILAWRIHGQGSLAGHSPWGCKESNTAEQLALTSRARVLSCCLKFYICSCLCTVFLGWGLYTSHFHFLSFFPLKPQRVTYGA